MKTKQTMRFSKEELELIKNTFFERDEVLFALRRHFLQLKLNENEKGMLKTIVNDKVLDVVKKVFLPDIAESGIIPLGQVSSLWFQAYNDVKNVPVDDTYNIIKARELFINYLKQQIKALKEDDNMENVTILDDLLNTDIEDKEKLLINIKAWNSIVSYVEQMLKQLETLSNMKEISEEEQMKMNKMNSNK